MNDKTLKVRKKVEMREVETGYSLKIERVKYFDQYTLSFLSPFFFLFHFFRVPSAPNIYWKSQSYCNLSIHLTIKWREESLSSMREENKENKWNLVAKKELSKNELAKCYDRSRSTKRVIGFDTSGFWIQSD